MNKVISAISLVIMCVSGFMFPDAVARSRLGFSNQGPAEKPSSEKNDPVRKEQSSTQDQAQAQNQSTDKK